MNIATILPHSAKTDTVCPVCFHEQPAKPQETNFIIHHSSLKLPSARAMRPLWRDLILRVWGTDPLKCPCCQGTMRRVETIVRKEEIEKRRRIGGVLDRNPRSG